MGSMMFWLGIIFVWIALRARVDLMLILWCHSRAYDKAHRNDPPLRPMTEKERLMCDPRWNNELGRLVG